MPKINYLPFYAILVPFLNVFVVWICTKSKGKTYSAYFCIKKSQVLLQESALFKPKTQIVSYTSMFLILLSKIWFGSATHNNPLRKFLISTELPSFNNLVLHSGYFVKISFNLRVLKKNRKMSHSAKKTSAIFLPLQKHKILV